MSRECDDFNSELMRHSYSLVKFCYSLPIPKSFSSQIIDHVSAFLLDSPLSKTIAKVENLSKHTDDKVVVDAIVGELKLFQRSLSEFDSEFKVIKALKEKQVFVDPVQTLYPKCIDIPKSLTSCTTIQICRVFKMFFECPGILEMALKFQSHCSSHSGIIFHFLQSPTWLDLKSLNSTSENTVLMPIFFYYDDFESKNPLGSHKGVHKLGGSYVSIPSFPPEIENSIGNLFLASLFHTVLKTKIGTTEIFSTLVESFCLLNSNGIVVKVAGHSFKIKFQLSQVIGDNLGLNSLGGFVESFSANYFCRVCKVPNETCQFLCVEEEASLRDRSNYTRDLYTCDPSATGLKELCFLQKVPNFHVIDHFCLDTMHDILEGIARYEMKLLVTDLISKGYFTLDVLNSRLLTFKFASSENRPPQLNSEQLSKDMLILSASEMLNLVSYFGLLVGDLVPRNDKSWYLYSLLRTITSIVMSFHVKKSTADRLSVLIEAHHKTYLELFEGQHLKPKHHFLLHYPSKIRKVGPLRQLSSLRFEAFHKQFKTSAKNSCNTMNLPLTLATKWQIDLAFQLETPQPNPLILGRPMSFEMESNFYSQAGNEYELGKYSNFRSQGFSTYQSAQFRCFEYKANDIFVNNFNESGPCFSQIECILSDGKTCLLFARKLYYPCYDYHFQAYQVERTQFIHIVNASELGVKKTLPIMSNVHNVMFVCPKYEL
jgi:hypothetical protein